MSRSLRASRPLADVAGDPVLDRLDILAVDPAGRIVVAELKRGLAPHAVHMQALNYAAMVSRLTPEDVAELYSTTRNRGGQDVDVDAALTILTTETLLTPESIRRPRIVLVASDFPPPVTATVVWLNEQGVDISLIRFRSYQLGDGQLVVSFSRLFPVPDVEEFHDRQADRPDRFGGKQARRPLGRVSAAAPGCAGQYAHSHAAGPTFRRGSKHRHHQGCGAAGRMQ